MRVVFILLLFPFYGMTQINLEMILIDCEISEQIEGATVRVGSKSAMSASYDFTSLYNLNTDDLDDTLFIEHTSFSFPNVPLLSHPYSLVNGNLRMRVYGRNWIKKQISINVPIAKLKKAINDSVQLNLCNHGENAAISLTEQRGKKFKKISISPKTAYDDLVDGTLIVKSDHQTRNVPFKKENWYQTLCLEEHRFVKVNENELEIFRMYFAYKKSSEERMNKKEWEHKKEVYRLEEKIDSLELEIWKLKDIIVPGYAELVPELEPEEEEMYFVDFVNNLANPPGGYEKFTSRLEAFLKGLETKYSGNITLEIWVRKDGTIITETLHAGEDKFELRGQLVEYLNNQRWKPASHSGRRVNEKVILSVNISKA